MGGRRHVRSRSQSPSWMRVLVAIALLPVAVSCLGMLALAPWSHGFIPSERLSRLSNNVGTIVAGLTLLGVIPSLLVRKISQKSGAEAYSAGKKMFLLLASPLFGYLACTAFILTGLGYVLHEMSPPHDAEVTLRVVSAPDFTLRRCGRAAMLESYYWMDRRICHLSGDASEVLRHGGWIRARASVSPYGLRVSEIEGVGSDLSPGEN